MAKASHSRHTGVIDAAINHEHNLSFLITTPVKGPDGLYIAVREAINNSLDAGAKNIRIEYDQYNGEDAILIHDNGVGFNKAGVKSAMSYAYSSRDRNDTSTIGANGTGLKGFLGLNSKIEKTKLTILSVHKDIPNCTKLEITFNYLVSLAKGEVRADEYVASIGLPKKWESSIKRTTGTTLILTGYDTRRMKDATQLIEELAEFLTPRAAQFVEVWDKSGWRALKPKVFSGKPYDFEHTVDKLGKIEFKLYYGGSTSDTLTVCGPVNAILDLNQLNRIMNKGARGRVSNLWAGIAGHIYIENANRYRTHDGSFSEEFYSSPASEEFLEILKLVSDELAELVDQENLDKQLAEKKQLIDRIIKAGSLYTTINPAQSGITPKPKTTTDKPIYIVPRSLEVHVGQEVSITPRNMGTQKMNFNDAAWFCNNELIAFQSTKGHSVRIKAGQIPGDGLITVKHEFGLHTIALDVVPATAHIAGPRSITPGGSYSYEMKLLGHKNFAWSLENKNKDVSLVVDLQNRNQVSLKVTEQCQNCVVELVAKENKSGGEEFRKKISIHNKVIGHSSEPIIQIGKHQYRLTVGAQFANTIAQVDYFNSDDADEYVPIVINPLHPRVKKLNNYLALDHILVSIASAAVIDQVAKNQLEPMKAQAIVEEFVGKIKEEVNKMYEEERAKVKEAERQAKEQKKEEKKKRKG